MGNRILVSRVTGRDTHHYINKNQLIVNVRVYFWILNFIPSTYKSIYSSVVSFEIRELESSNFVLLFHRSFSYSGSLEFPFLRLFSLLG